MTGRAENRALAEAFLDGNRGLLYRVAASYEADGGRREDLLQELALAIWQAAASFRGDAAFRTFALRVAHNRAATWSLREARRRRAEAPSEAAFPPIDDRSVDVLVQQEALLEAVRQLSLGQRQVLSLAFEGLSYDEIAAVLAITRSNVGVRLNRARTRLQELLDA